MIELFSHGQHEDLGNRRFRTTLGLKSVNFKRNGVYRRITNILGASGDPNFPIGVDELLQFRLDTRIAGKSPLFYFGKGQSRGTFALVGANNVSGKVNGNSVKFVNAWDNADLTYVLAGHRLQEEILFKTGHPREIGFWINENVGFDPTTLVFGNDFRILQPILHPPAGSDKEMVPLTWQVAQSGGKWLLTCKLPAGDWAGWTLDPTLSLQPDPTDGMDTYLSSVNSDMNYAVVERVYLTTLHTPLLKFNLPPILAGSTINSVILSLWNINQTGFSKSYTVHSILSANSAWTEAGATWNYAVATTTRWAGDTDGDGGADAGCTVSGIDFNATNLGSFSYIKNTAAGTEHPITLVASQVQAWLTANYGLTARQLTTAGPEWCSSDYTTNITWRPKLVVDFLLPSGAIFNVPFSAPFRGPFG